MSDADLTRLLRDLTREVQTLQRELDDSGRRGLPSGSQLSRFTSEVAIPGVILVLETNIRALQLLRRTIRLVDGREPRDARGGAGSELRDRAEQLGETTLARLDSALADVQQTLEAQDGTDEASEILAEARQLQSRIRDEFDTETDQPERTEGEQSRKGPVDIDVDSELRTLKQNLEDDGDGAGGDGGGEPTGDGDGDAGDGGADS